MSIVQTGGVQVLALAGGKQAAQCGQGQPGLALVQPPEDDANGLPLVIVPVAGATFEAEVAESGQCVAFGVGAAGSLRLGVIPLRVQNPAFFHGEHENQPVHQPQQLLEVGVATQLTTVQRSTQVVVGWMLQKTLTQREQCLFDAVAQAIPYPGTFLLTLVAPSFPDAGRILGICKCPAGMQQPPCIGKLGVVFAAQQVDQVDFQKTRAGKRRGITQQPQLPAVADDAPQQRFAGIEQFLHGLERGLAAAAAAFDGHAGVGVVQPQCVGRHQNGQITCQEADRVTPSIHFQWPCRTQVVAKGVAQQLLHKAGGELGSVDVPPFQLLGKVLPLGAGNLEGAAVFILGLEALGQPVVSILLGAGKALRGLLNLIGQEKSTFQCQRGRKGEGSLGLAGAFHVRACPCQWCLWLSGSCLWLGQGYGFSHSWCVWWPSE